jgi:hypothetical protein
LADAKHDERAATQTDDGSDSNRAGSSIASPTYRVRLMVSTAVPPLPRDRTL